MCVEGKWECPALVTYIQKTQEGDIYIYIYIYLGVCIENASCTAKVGTRVGESGINDDRAITYPN